MQSPTQHLADLLGLTPAPEYLLDWHNRIVEGFPAQSIKSLASATGLPSTRICAVAGVSGASKKQLSREASNVLYRIAVLWVALEGTFVGQPANAVKWLATEHAGLRGRVPLQLVGSSIGFEYAKAAVQRDSD
jgi:putative toxin-antitoxin system antitoxin component (TIGR02293 family)